MHELGIAQEILKIALDYVAKNNATRVTAFNVEMSAAADEGKVVVIVGREDADKVLQVMRAKPLGKEAVVIGEVRAEPPNRVLMKTRIGSTRVVDVLMGEMLPRVC